MVLTTVRTVLGCVLAVPPAVWAVVELWEWWIDRRKRQSRKRQKGPPPGKPFWGKSPSGLGRPAEDPVEPSDLLAGSEVSVSGDSLVAVDPGSSGVHEYVS
jgi:hypothetical protein